MIDFIDAYSKKWDFYLSEFDQEKLDIYYTKEYCRLYETNLAKAFLFVFKEQNKIAIYPVIKTLITGYNDFNDYYDIETPYGYGGPLVNTDDKLFIDRFEDQFINFCNRNKIIAEFIRFHPVLENHNIFKKNVEIIFDRNTILVELNKGIDRIWDEDITSKNRNMIRKAIKNELRFEKANDYRDFRNIYDKTMQKVHASSFYFFNDNYYRDISMIKETIVFNIKFEEDTIASAIFMKYNKYFHYHLSGSKKEFLNLAPNNFLLWEAIKYACVNGCSYFHLGGGTNNCLDNSLYKFKKSFSKKEIKFFIGKRIHNMNVYKQLIKKWTEKNNKDATILLQYRE